MRARRVLVPAAFVCLLVLGTRIPVIFYFTGIHPDDHRPSDTVDEIVFDKVAWNAQLAHETGRRVANLDRMVVRDNKGRVWAGG